MPLWRIRPVAHPGDSHWQGRRIWADVVVRAPSAAFARLAASKLDEPPMQCQLGNETHCLRSGFEDEKLYWVRQVGSAEADIYENVGASSRRDRGCALVRPGRRRGPLPQQWHRLSVFWRARACQDEQAGGGQNRGLGSQNRTGHTKQPGHGQRARHSQYCCDLCAGIDAAMASPVVQQAPEAGMREEPSVEARRGPRESVGGDNQKGCCRHERQDRAGSAARGRRGADDHPEGATVHCSTAGATGWLSTEGLCASLVGSGSTLERGECRHGVGVGRAGAHLGSDPDGFHDLLWQCAFLGCGFRVPLNAVGALGHMSDRDRKSIVWSSAIARRPERRLC